MVFSLNPTTYGLAVGEARCPSLPDIGGQGTPIALTIHSFDPTLQMIG